MSRSVRTLIVASTERLRRACSQLLADVPGFEVVTLATREEAREAASRYHPDILLLAVEPGALRDLQTADPPKPRGDDAPAADAPAIPALSLLTPREREVLRMAAEGLSSTETGRQLGISARTAECHRAHGMRKLGLHRRADLVRFAMTAGLVGGRSDLR